MLEVAFMSEFEKVSDVPATSAEPFDHQALLMENENIKRSFDEVAKEKLDNLADDDPDNEEPTIMHTKKLRIGSGNIIGKGVIQDFFTCAGTLPTLGGSILNKTNSLADALTLLIIELERQFVHMHPCIQRIFLEFSNVQHPSVKRAATIFLAHEFRFIMKEASKIFAHYKLMVDAPL